MYGTAGKLSVYRDHLLIETVDGHERIDVAQSDPFVDEFRDFYGSVVHGTPLRASPRDALNDLALVEAAILSATEGSVVRMEDFLGNVFPS